MGYLGDIHRQGLTYNQMARLLGVSVHTIYSWARRKQPSKMTKATRRLIDVLTLLRNEAPMLHDALVKIAKADCSSKSTKTH